MDEYYAAIRRLPGFLRRPLEDLSPRQAQTIHEIHLRSGRPVVIALSTNDGLAASFSNLAALTNRKHYYMVPFAQDDYLKKPSSLQSDFSLIRDTLECALRGRQLGPVLNV